MIEFLEDASSSYSPRTWRNAGEADATIAVAIDFNTAGEKLTKKAATTQGKLFIQLHLNLQGEIIPEDYDPLQNFIKEFNDRGCSILNIAGNGIYTLSRYHIPQQVLDATIYKLIVYMLFQGLCKITTIRSGGQTGVDESGLKVGDYLCLRTICLAPKGWRFRIEDGDIYDEELFKRRFERTLGRL